jgi:DNA replication protein DnaC
MLLAHMGRDGSVMSETQFIEGPCTTGCGHTVRRQRVEATRVAKLAEFINARPLLCPECIAAQEAEEQAAVAESERRQHARQVARLVAQSHLPVKHQSRLLSDLEKSDEVLDSARHWVQHGGGFLLTGMVGRGKTMVAGAAALQHLQRRRPLRWCSAPILMARLSTGFGAPMHDWALEVLEGRHALVLDDIDKTRPSEYAAEQIFAAIDTRVENRVPLIVTSNLSLGQMAERWPENWADPIVSRLVGYCRVVRVEGEDWRLSKPVELSA